MGLTLERHRSLEPPRCRRRWASSEGASGRRGPGGARHRRQVGRGTAGRERLGQIFERLLLGVYAEEDLDHAPHGHHAGPMR